MDLSTCQTIVHRFINVEKNSDLHLQHFSLNGLSVSGRGKRGSKECFKVIKNIITMFSEKDDRINVLEMVIENSLCKPLVLLITTFITSNGFLHVHTHDAKTINTSNEL